MDSKSTTPNPSVSAEPCLRPFVSVRGVSAESPLPLRGAAPFPASLAPNSSAVVLYFAAVSYFSLCVAT